MTPGNLRFLTELVRARSGIVLGPDKLYLMRARLDPLLRDERLADLDALVARLACAPAGELAWRAVEAVTVNETMFFRHPSAFEHLGTVALPRLRAARPAGHRLRLWSAAASTGQEAYSLAITALESRPAWPEAEVEVVATDIARAALRRAEAGLYSQFEVSRGLSTARMRQHFGPEPGGWRALPARRAMLQCRPWNLLDNPAPLGRFDVVFCRNVLIYFAPDTRSAVLDRLADRLAPDGYLYLGGSETSLGLGRRFRPVADQHGVFAPIS